jgi:hypothetical protein
MFDLLFNNAFIRTIKSVVNFCNEQCAFEAKKLKFSKKMPIKRVESPKPQFGQIVAKTR